MFSNCSGKEVLASNHSERLQDRIVGREVDKGVVLRMVRAWMRMIRG